VAEQRVAVADLAVAEEHAAVADVGNQSLVIFLVARKILKWRESICGERS
jgi:hypothetical protein